MPRNCQLSSQSLNETCSWLFLRISPHIFNYSLGLPFPTSVCNLSTAKGFYSPRLPSAKALCLTFTPFPHFWASYLLAITSTTPAATVPSEHVYRTPHFPPQDSSSKAAREQVSESSSLFYIMSPNALFLSEAQFTEPWAPSSPNLMT